MAADRGVRESRRPRIRWLAEAGGAGAGRRRRVVVRWWRVRRRVAEKKKFPNFVKTKLQKKIPMPFNGLQPF